MNNQENIMPKVFFGVFAVVMLLMVGLFYIGSEGTFNDDIAKNMITDRGYRSVKIGDVAPFTCVGRYQPYSRYFVAKRRDGHWVSGVLCAGSYGQSITIDEYKVH